MSEICNECGGSGTKTTLHGPEHSPNSIAFEKCPSCDGRPRFFHPDKLALVDALEAIDAMFDRLQPTHDQKFIEYRSMLKTSIDTLRRAAEYRGP